MSDQDKNKDYIKGRGAQINPQNPNVKHSYTKDFAEGIDDWEKLAPKTNYITEVSESIAKQEESIDIPLEWSVNPYQGCEHGCVYCYARPTHQEWGYSAGTDFESNIVVKHNAPQLLRNLFNGPFWQPNIISVSGGTDPYQPAERKYKLTREILKTCLDFRNPVAIVTKNALVLRDIDIIQELSKHNLVQVFTSITATDEKLRLQLEPRTSTYADRFRTIEILASYDVPVGILHAPIIPGINDHEIPKVLQRAADAGAKWAGYTIVRLNGPVADLFTDWLQKNYSDRVDKVLNNIRACNGGSLGDDIVGKRSTGEGNVASMIAQQFNIYCKKYGLQMGSLSLDTTHFRKKSDGPLDLFS